MKSAEERLRSARILMDEGQHKDSISRSYYAMFDSARAAVMAKGKEAKTHKGIHILFGKEYAQYGDMEKELGSMLHSAEEERESADYDVEITFTKDDAENALQKAGMFLRAVKKILKKKKA